jgi:hypothetical protein
MGFGRHAILCTGAFPGSRNLAAADDGILKKSQPPDHFAGPLEWSRVDTLAVEPAVDQVSRCHGSQVLTNADAIPFLVLPSSGRVSMRAFAQRRAGG